MQNNVKRWRVMPRPACVRTSSEETLAFLFSHFSSLDHLAHWATHTDVSNHLNVFTEQSPVCLHHILMLETLKIILANMSRTFLVQTTVPIKSNHTQSQPQWKSDSGISSCPWELQTQMSSGVVTNRTWKHTVVNPSFRFCGHPSYLPMDATFKFDE